MTGSGSSSGVKGGVASRCGVTSTEWQGTVTSLFLALYLYECSLGPQTRQELLLAFPCRPKKGHRPPRGTLGLGKKLAFCSSGCKTEPCGFFSVAGAGQAGPGVQPLVASLSEAVSHAGGVGAYGDVEAGELQRERPQGAGSPAGRPRTGFQEALSVELCTSTFGRNAEQNKMKAMPSSPGVAWDFPVRLEMKDPRQASALVY